MLCHEACLVTVQKKKDLNVFVRLPLPEYQLQKNRQNKFASCKLRLKKKVSSVLQLIVFRIDKPKI